MIDFVPTTLSGAFTIELQPLKDNRGLFVRTFDKNEFARIGHTAEFVQSNHSVNFKKGTLRGMHFQVPPYAEIKLIRCVAGSVFDVIVDLRSDSSTYLKWFGTELSASNMTMMYVPKGFAHGFFSLEDNSDLLYHHTEFYTPAADRGLRYDDPSLGIQWPGLVEVVSEKDRSYQLIEKDFQGITL